jgi:hypothetical protein
MINDFKNFQLNELFVGPIKSDKPTKIKLSAQYTLMVHVDRQFEGKGSFELYLKEKCVAIGEYELSMRPIVEDEPHYKMVQVMGSKFKVEPKGEKSKQTNLFNIKSYKVGCGSILMGGIIKWASQSKMKTIWLDVLKTNERAIHLYQKYGFKIDKEYERLAKQATWYRMYINL